MLLVAGIFAGLVGFVAVCVVAFGVYCLYLVFTRTM